ncbi:unnamed protein product [Rotaria magnacalcarata]|uniref:DDE-1 domain-containing protein n=5 Tax=Rotaria magnacalcarata TaxID=392030 RepID=A0A816WAA6_9BILA|nr:unnamed protein product [Rotaria magnacalcarata]
MVRNYIRKTDKRSYTEADLINAVEKVRTKEWTYEKASSETNIPIGTLASRISRNSNHHVGRPTALTKTEEKNLVDLIITLQDYGELSTCDDVLKYATEFVDIMNLKSRLKNGVPTRDWYYGFLRRWKDRLKIMNSTKLEKVRADVTLSTVDGWFAKLHSVLLKLDLFNKPQQLFNCDESGFRDDPGKKKVVVSRDTKYANKIHTGSGKENTTVLLTISATGVCLPPYVIYKSKCLYDTWCPRNVIRGAVFNRTESGWINEDTFFDYLENMFIPQTKHIPRPLLLIFDGHTSHLSLKTARLAIENDIHLLCLPAHATHLLQPLDVYTLKYVKAQWRSLLWDYSKKNATKKLDKPNFIRLYAQLYQYALMPTHCSSAFGKAGIFPYDPRAIKRDKLIKASSRSTTSNALPRSKSVEFNYHDNDVITTTSPSPLRLHSNRNRQLVKYPSDPALFSGYDESNKTQQQRESVNSYQDAISSIDHALRATDSIVASTITSPIQSIIIINPASSNDSDLSISNTNDNSLALSTSNATNNSLALSTSNVNNNSLTLSTSNATNNSLALSTSNANNNSLALSTSNTNNNSLILSASNTNDNLLVPSQSTENNRSLDAIETIVKKYFSQSSTKCTKGKKRVVSGANGANGRSVTDLDEFALTTIKKKKTTEAKLTKKNNSKKTNLTQKQNVRSITDIYNANGTNIADSTSTTNVTPAGIHNGSLPPITYMLPSNTSQMISTYSSNFGSYTPLHNLSAMPPTQCQLCFHFIKPLEMTSNCNQCHRILCWECSSKIDRTHQLCQSCRTYYTNQQQTYFNYNQ